MIDEIRLFLAVLLFCLGMYLIWDLFSAGFSLVVLISSVLCFVVAHYIKPESDTREDSSALWDVIDYIVDIPFKTISVFLRTIGRPFKGDVDGVDL